MRLFVKEGFTVDISPEALALKPFRDIWKRDESKNKDKAMLELGFIFYMLDPRSDYMYLTNEDERMERIKKDQGFDANWQPDKVVKKAMDVVSSLKPQSALLLEATRRQVNKLIKQMDSMDFDERDDHGKPVYTINTVTAAVDKIPELIEKLNKSQRIVDKDILEQEKIRGTKDMTLADKNLDAFIEEQVREG